MFTRSFFERGARDEDVDSRIREVAARNSGQEPGSRTAARQDPEDVASSLAETGAERRFGRRSRFGRRADRQGPPAAEGLGDDAGISGSLRNYILGGLSNDMT